MSKKHSDDERASKITLQNNNNRLDIPNTPTTPDVPPVVQTGAASNTPSNEEYMTFDSLNDADKGLSVGAKKDANNAAEVKTVTPTTEVKGATPISERTPQDNSNRTIIPKTPTPPSPKSVIPTTDKDADKHKFYNWMRGEAQRQYAEDKARDAEREKRLKRQKLFATIGDGLSAMGEAYNNARYGTPYSDPQKSLSNRWKEKYDKLLEERSKRTKGYLTDMERLENLRYNEEWRKQQQEYRNDQLQLKKEEADRKKALSEAQVERIKAQQAKDEKQIAYYDAYIHYLERGMRVKEAAAAAKAASDSVRAQAAMVAAQNKGGGNNVGEYTTTEIITRDKLGNVTERKKVRTRNGSTTTTTSQGGGTAQGGKKKLPDASGGKKKLPGM